jgi:hypothetical protein
MTFCQDPHRARVLRLFDARTAGRRPLTTGAGGELQSVILRWIVSRASGVYSEHTRVVRIASTLSRDTSQIFKATVLQGRGRLRAALTALGCFHQIQDTLQRDVHPVGTAIEFVPQLVEGLLQEVGIQEHLAFLLRLGEERPLVCDSAVGV